MKAMMRRPLLGLLFCSLLTSCGGGGGADSPSATGEAGRSSGENQVAGITGGVVVDPYIAGATFFEDRNGNGVREAGEQISTESDENGCFLFASPIDLESGSFIVMYDRGTHQGLPFTGRLLRRVTPQDGEQVVVSPLTTIKALGLSPADLVDPLRALHGEDRVNGYDPERDPVAGLGEVAGNGELAELRANLYLGAVLDIYLANKDLTGVTRQELLHLLQNWPPLGVLMEGLAYAVRLESLETIELPADPGLPRLTMLEIAQALPAILDWWKLEVAERKITGRPLLTEAEFKQKVDAALPELGRWYYARNHAGKAAVQQAMQAGRLPRVAAGAHVCLQPDGSLGDPRQETFARLELAGERFTLGDEGALVFQDGSILEFTPAGGETSYGTWRVEEELLILQGPDSPEELRLDFVSRWPNYFRIRVRQEPQDPKALFLKSLLNESRRFSPVDF